MKHEGSKHKKGCEPGSSEYNKMHGYLKYHHGSASKCESKTCSGKSTNYTYALKKGRTYSYKRADYKQLCRSCHTKYDHTEEGSERARLRLLGKVIGPTTPVTGVNLLTGEVVQFPSMASASRAMKARSDKLKKVLKTPSKTAFGYKWERT